MQKTKWLCGISLGCFFDGCTPAHIRLCKENGILAVEVNHTVSDVDGVKKAAAENGVTLWAYHLPFLPFEQFDPASPDPKIKQDTFSLHKKCLEQAAQLGVKIAVIHPSGEPIPKQKRKQRMTAAKAYLQDLADLADRFDITVAVENLPRTCLGNTIEEMQELLSADPRLRVCFDTNHLLDEPAADFIRKVGNKIVTVHISDYDFHNEKHWLPYEGDIHWVELVTALEQIGYSGPFLYEVASEPRPMNSRHHPTITRPRPLTLKDVKENFTSCVNKRPATPLGVRNKEECLYSADWKNHR